MNDSHSTSALIDRFLESFNSDDLGAMRSALVDDAVAFVTGPDRKPVRLDGAAHLLRVAGGKIVAMYMVDAKPAESDAVWA